ncbi:MAG: glycosyl hydrolase family 2, partial [Opitutaceae bacterium]|nr:glycosyl hydrolase family 2 [Opitutaceae bacterium]
MTPLPRSFRRFAWLCSGLVLGCLTACASTSITPAKPNAGASAPLVELAPTPAGGWRLLRDGKPYEIRGAGGTDQLELVKAIGGNTIRTWGIDQLDRRENGKTLLDRCSALGLTIMAGIWVEHERHGFDYSNPADVRRQRETVRAAVRAYKHHPAILIWGLGNEMEGPTSDGSDPRIWRELEELIKIVKEEDPSRPVCTVIAGAATGKIRALMRDYPSLDILGVNAYGGAAGAGAAAAAAGWTKPFILAEYGPVGHWEVAQTSWGAPIEPSSKEKASNYFASHRGAMEDSRGLCIGTFAFVWGHKQETTATWYGMFL